MTTPNVFIGATRQNDGKTSVSLGLLNSLQKRFGNVAYMKPVGQQYKIVNGLKIDKDAVLFKEVYGLEHPLESMSPIAVEEGFTQSYLLNPNVSILQERIHNAYQNLANNSDFALIEGTGHGGGWVCI